MLIMFLIKMATFVAFLVALLVISLLVKAISDQQKEMAMLKRKNAALLAELNTAENVAGLKADFEEVLKNDN